MIVSHNGSVTIEGQALDICADLACAIKSVYENLVELLGEDEANKLLAEIGRAAVDKDAIERRT